MVSGSQISFFSDGLFVAILTSHVVDIAWLVTTTEYFLFVPDPFQEWLCSDISSAALFSV